MSNLRENVKEVIRHGLCSKYPVWHSSGQHTEGYIKLKKVAISQLTTTPLLPPREVSAAELRGRSSFCQVCIKFPLSSSSSPPSSASSHPSLSLPRLSRCLFPHLHTPFSPSLISLMVSMGVKDHVYLRFQFTTTPLLEPTEVSAAQPRGRGCFVFLPRMYQVFCFSFLSFFFVSFFSFLFYFFSFPFLTVSSSLLFLLLLI